MSLSPEHRAKLLADTREPAAAFLDDLDHLREVCAATAVSGPTLRRASAVLRRLLVESDINQVAVPRVGRMSFLMPDNERFYDEAKRSPFMYFASGGMMCFGVYFRAIGWDANGSSLQMLHAAKPMEDVIAGRLDNFMSQRVICHDGKWATRRDVIKYVANVASGVHSGSLKEDIDPMLSLIRRSVWCTRETEGEPSFSVTFDMHALRSEAEPVFRYSPRDIDPLLVELLTIMNYLLVSPDVVKLGEAIRAEISPV